MDKCQLKVNSSSYNQTFNSKAKTVKLEGGYSSIVATIDTKPNRVTVNWITNNCGYGYLIAFYFACFGKAFQIDLIDNITGAVSTQICKIVYGTLSVTMQDGNAILVAMNLEIVK